MKRQTNLSKAFAQLRKDGYFAKQNFMCCQSCGWAEMSEAEAEKAVFYHAQDAADLRKGDDLYLCWSGNGHQIARALEHHGMEVEWDGTTSTRIVVRNSSII
jgi:hypothetical protein